MCNNDNNDSCQKILGKTFFAGFQLTVLENNPTFMKETVLHTTILMHCKARKVLLNLFITNQRNGSEMRFVAGATKINLKNLKTSFFNDLMQATI